MNLLRQRRTREFMSWKSISMTSIPIKSIAFYVVLQFAKRSSCAKMYLILKLTIVILILYLKLNGLNAIPIIERHKSSVSALTLYTKPNVNQWKSNTNNRNQKNYDNKSIDIIITATTKTTTTTINEESKILTKNALELNPIEMKKANQEFTPIDYNLNDSNNNKSSYYHYNIIDRNENNNTTTNKNNNNFNEDKRNLNITNAASTNSTKLSFINETMTHSATAIPEIIYPAVSNENFELNNNINENDNEFGLGNILINTFNNTDVNRFLLRYDNDDGNTCFLDVIKDTLMWWSNKNGSLHGEAIFNVTKENRFLDFSFRNISNDDCLYKKTRTYTFLHGYKIIAFSAAQNNLTHAPYRTLSLVNSTLKYLSLKGNQFAAYTTEMQRDALNRIIQDTNRHPYTSTETSTEMYTMFDNDTRTPIMTTIPMYTDDLDLDDKVTLEADDRSGYDSKRSHQSTYRKYKNKVFGKGDEGIAWATFPPMPFLTELDISNCHIEFITRDAFQNLTSLRRLYLAHNKMLTIPHDTFQYVPSLQYLDLSFTNVLDSDYQIPLPTLQAIYNLIYGVKIQQMTFRHLPDLVYLDLSHTKLTRNSAVAFTHLGDKLRYLSLCYTAFPMIGNALFKNTALVGLDLSGNPYAAYNIIEDAFEGVADTLKYLYFERSNIKDLSWLKYLSNLRVLDLAGNNINSISLEIFSPLRSMQLLDLSSNHIGNWYNRAFTHNEQLRILSLRDNNINIITSEMLRDFQLLDYLSLGDNNFVCDCLLQDLVDIAAANNKDAQCSHSLLQEAQDILTDNAYLVEDYFSPSTSLKVKRSFRTAKTAVSLQENGQITINYDVAQMLMQRYMPLLKRSLENIKQVKHRPKIRVVSQFYRAINEFSSSTQCGESEPIVIHNKLNSSTLKFQLLDYEDEHYWCFNETERLHFMQLNCQPRNYVEDITQQLHTLTKYVVGSVCSVIGISLIAVLLYLKRWHIHYYFSYLKTAALVSVAAKDAADQFNSLAESDPNLVYDIFLSYCQSDRQWVVEELLPNVEESGDVSICMHERDFQIGLTILDNIVSCMDRSRALMLIISSNFLLSHWCQFEMHLAQHRIFEVSKEHLILVFLEDIPRNKRPKTLQYLMEVKTYIKWPNTGKNGERTPSADERKFFWKRLKRSLENIGLNPYPSPRESHA